MSDSDHHEAEPSAPSLEMLALAEALERMRAAGEARRPGQLPGQVRAALAGSPDAAGSLADALMNGLDTEDEEDTDMLATGASAEDAPAQLSPGTLRGLAAIFGTDDGAAGEDAPSTPAYLVVDEENEPPALVAETPASYQADAGLLALARGQRLDTESLAARMMLTPAALDWLDRIALPLDRQPEALVAHLVGALGVERALVRAALELGEPLASMEADTLMELLTRAGSLTPAQRNYWDALLSLQSTGA
jgi:hypothetical protein